jgi:TPR repeat protein
LTDFRYTPTATVGGRYGLEILDSLCRQPDRLRGDDGRHCCHSPEAQFQLGLLYAQGIGGPKDDAAARVLFEKAAAQGHADANMWAGAFLEIGRGGPKDEARAKAYYEKAAVLGNAQAKTALHRIECPRVLKDKNGKILTHLCF